MIIWLAYWLAEYEREKKIMQLHYLLFCTYVCIEK